MESHIKESIIIDKDRNEVWDALVNPAKIERYMYGSKTRTDWQPGHPIEFFADMEGEETKVVHGRVLENNPPSRLIYSVFPSTSEMEDIPENHLSTIFELADEDGQTRLSVSQSDFTKVANGAERYQHASQGWDTILEQIKEICENE